MRRGALVVGIALIVLAVVVIVGWVPWVPAATTQQRDEFDAAVVRLDLGSGSVIIRRGQVQRISLQAQARSWWGQPRRGWRQDGDAVVLGDCGRHCPVHYELVVPAGIRVAGEAASGSVSIDGVQAVDVKVNSGPVDIGNVPGPVHASVDAGSLTLNRIGGAIAAQSSSGAIVGRDLAGPVRATTDAGDLRLGLARQQDVDAETSTGDVALTVPPGHYRVDSRAGVGEGSVDEGENHVGEGENRDEGAGRIGVANDPNALYALRLGTSTGTITVRQKT